MATCVVWVKASGDGEEMENVSFCREKKRNRENVYLTQHTTYFKYLSRK